MKFYLMNKDTALCLLYIDDFNVQILKQYDDMPFHILKNSEWIFNRSSPIGRINILKLLKLNGIDNSREKYLAVSYGVSLTDTLWFKGVSDKVTWRKVSPYTNRFSHIISELALNGNYYGGSLKSPSPEYTVSGSTNKCWKRENGRIYLYKTDQERWSNAVGNRPYCEYYASQVADQLISNKKHFVKYNIKVNKTSNGSNKAYVYSELFTSEKFGYLPICDSIYRDMSFYELDNILPTDSREILREMLILDALVLNCDRHKGNYGFLFNNDTFKIQSLAPIFDQDCSFGFKTSLKQFDGNLEEAYKEVAAFEPRTQLGGYIAQAKKSLTSKYRSNLKNMYPFHFNRLKSDIDLEDERIEFMEYVVNKNIKEILA